MMNEGQKLNLHESLSHAQMDKEFEKAAKEVEAFYKKHDKLRQENAELKERIKELEDALAKFEQWFGGDKYRDILKWKERFALEQQAKGVEWCLEEFCTIANDDAKKTMRDKLEQLRKQAEEL